MKVIKLIDNYEIIGNEIDYTLVRRIGKKDKKGNDIFKVCGDYGTVQACINACLQDKCIELTKEKTMMLHEAIQEFKKIEKRLESVMIGVNREE